MQFYKSFPSNSQNTSMKKRKKKNRISDGPFNEIEIARFHNSAQISDFQEILKLEELITFPELKKKKKN